MPLFRYEIVDKTGKTMIGVMDAPSESVVRERWASKGYSVNMIVPTSRPPSTHRGRVAAGGLAARVIFAPWRRASRVSAPLTEMAVFFRSLASYLHAGVGLHQALTQIAGQTPHKAMGRIAESMAARVQAGDRLSDAMAEFPRAFPPHVMGVAAAGELGGFLPIIMGDIALDYELAQRASVRWLKLVSRLLWVHAVGLLVLAPFPMKIFTPGVTDLQSGIAHYIKWTVPHVVAPLAILIIGYHVTAAVLRQPSMHPVHCRLMLKVPQVGRALRERSLAMFSRTLWRLQSAGILPIQAWDAASRAAEDVVISSRLLEQVQAIRSGRKFSEAIISTGLFTGEDARVLATAEATGQTADSLQRIAAYYEDAALTSAKRAMWLALRVALLANVPGVVAISASSILYMESMMNWVDWFFGAG